jgi:hypothetical protein
MTDEYVWVAEAKYDIHTAWYMLWTTCRLTRSECQIALEEHPTRPMHVSSRIVKFMRDDTEKGNDERTNPITLHR